MSKISARRNGITELTAFVVAQNIIRLKGKGLRINVVGAGSGVTYNIGSDGTLYFVLSGSGEIGLIRGKGCKLKIIKSGTNVKLVGKGIRLTLTDDGKEFVGKGLRFTIPGFGLVPVQFDSNGDPVVDSNGDPVPPPLLDSSGDPVLDSNGDPVTDPDPDLGGGAGEPGDDEDPDFPGSVLPSITAIDPDTGAQSSAFYMTLTGNNLSGTSSVDFSGTGVTAEIIDEVSDSELLLLVTITKTAQVT